MNRRVTPGGQLIYTAGGMIAFQCMNILSGWWIARMLGAEGQGRFQIVISLSVFTAMVAKIGLDEGIAYRIPIIRRQQPESLGPLLRYSLLWAGGMGILAAVCVVYGLGPLLSAAVGGPSISTDIRWALLLIPCLMVLQTCLAQLRGLERADRRAIAYYILVGSSFLVLLLVTLRGENLSLAFTLRTVSFGLGIGLCLWWLLPILKQSGSIGSQRSQLHRFAGWLLLATWFRYLVEQPMVDLLLVGSAEGVESAGIYSVAARLAALLALTISSVALVVGPLFSGWLTEGQADRVRALHQSSARIIASFALCAAGAIYLAPEYWLAIFGDEYPEGRSFLMILTTGYLALALSGPSSPWLLAKGKAHIEGLATAIAAIVMVVGGLVGVYFLGGIGVAIATATAVATLGWFLLIQLIRTESLNPLSWITKPLFLSILLFAGVRILGESLHVLAQVLLFCSFFLVILSRMLWMDFKVVLSARSSVIP